MRISYNWLKDYVDIKLSPEKLAEVLTMAGLAVESFQKIGDDTIFEIEVTSNRPDCLSVIGIAREIAALTGRRLKVPPRLRPSGSLLRSSSFGGQVGGQASAKRRNTKHEQRTTISVKVEAKDLCPRYTGRIIRNVKVGESPEWLKTKIAAMGLRPVNNIVDITNFCLFETGEPMHAFDMDKISGGALIVRRAKKNERIVTIDGVERSLDESVLIIADGTSPIAIAGIMGGLDTEVSFSTKNILLEAAYFDPVATRLASRRLGISTESSYRFERKVNIENIAYSSDRASDLICGLAGGNAGEFFDIGKKSKSRISIDLRYGHLNRITGLDIPGEKTKRILNFLGLKTASSSKGKIKSRIPSFRIDLKSEIDLIEEILRVYGYDKIPKTMPSMVEQPVKSPLDMVVEKRIREVLSCQGLDEIITYGLLSKRLLGMAEMKTEDAIEIKNPLSSEQEILRPSLIPGMLNTILWNMNRKTKDLKLFELGRTYIKEGRGKFAEKNTLAIAMTGEASGNWMGGSRSITFFDLKGVLEALLSELGIDSFYLKETKHDSFSRAVCASIEIEGEAIGVLGELSQKVLENFDIEARIYLFELNAGPLIKHVRPEKEFVQLPKHPSVLRDISIIVGEDIPNEKILTAIKDAAGIMLKESRLIDRYKGRQVPDGKASLTYRLEYLDMKRTLEEKDIEALQSRILRELEDKFGARQRG